MDHSKLRIPGYTIHGQIGHGGMASVYLATQESLNRKVAIKVLRKSSDESLNARFIKEAHFIASLANPHIITIHDISTLTSGDYYIAMELLDGGDLTNNLDRFQEPDAILRLIQQIAEGLAVVHDKGIIHRDVKPANILFRNDGAAVLTDFGIAKDVDNNSDLTQAGFSLGSPSYSSPEQAQGQPIDITTDIYSLGVILLELLLGYNPFKGDSHTSTAINHIQQPVPVLPAELNYLSALLDRMLAKQPGDRFQSCRELAEAIEPLLRPEAKVPREKPLAPIATRLGTVQLAGKSYPLLLPAVAVIVAILLFSALTYESETDRQIRQLLEQAELSMDEGRYVFPEHDNARYYYRQVLLLDTDNSSATDGLETVTQKLIESYVTRGAEAMEEGRLNRPKGNNALHYYRKALALDGENPQALAGMEQLAAEFARRGRAGLLEGDLKRADYNVTRGLRISPEDEELLALRAQIDQKTPTTKKVLRNVLGKIRKTIDGRPE
ncbi:Serine/threonine-protein kinase StkP [Microbulbifer aggregans]|uniref:Serine/threonine-protein kinase StkP n=1 Tax=Microbulbifer aggregans TaxID=1769779 RepID=A0A1C9W4B1_9GAMM|nr:serine/threonine-protein kinase [Microbulbifer aggregans]AOS95996.1 Serine/threonine-protein kinase StkP [Microbulbifer aggregans]